VFGGIGADEVELPRLADPNVRKLLTTMELIEDAELSRCFPAERWARVRVALKDGRVLVSDPAVARGNPENPLSDGEMQSKYRELAEPAIGVEHATLVEQIVAGLAEGGAAAVGPLADAILRHPAP
jgi:2-methylcitrate dehydratase PrpD